MELERERESTFVKYFCKVSIVAESRANFSNLKTCFPRHYSIICHSFTGLLEFKRKRISINNEYRSR
jgi:hypothetical protein